MKKYCKKIWSVLILVFLICSCKTEEEPADSSQSEILAFLMQKLEFYDSKIINAIKENEASEEKVISVPPAKVTEITAQNLDSCVALTWKDPPDSNLFGIEISVSNNEEQNLESRFLQSVSSSCVIFPPGIQFAQFSNLHNDIQYTFTFTAINTNGERSAAVTKRITPKLIAKSPLVIKVFKSTEDITNSPVEIKIEVDSQSPVKTIKYETGERKADYFSNNGTTITESKNFIVQENGIFTVFAQDYDGRREVYEINISNISQLSDKNENTQEITNSITESEETNDVFEDIHTGDLIFSDGLVEGIVFGKNEEGIPLYVSIDKVQNLQWAVENSVGAVTKINAIAAKIANSTDFANIEFTGDTNGSDNFDEIIALSINDNSFSIENYPIFAFASNTGDNWYIPTAKEIYDLYSEKDLINKKLAELQKDPLFEDGHWWTSSQGAKKDTAFYLNLDTNRFSDGKKTISRKCCLIKKLKADYNSTQP
ncbi:MAG: fibronectin type III domain-containing protein [Treponema sp.]|nr:fibronectin type III domain-containing protein [Treponema sp.]